MTAKEKMANKLHFSVVLKAMVQCIQKHYRTENVNKYCCLQVNKQ